jgi:hypothetical protein
VRKLQHISFLIFALCVFTPKLIAQAAVSFDVLLSDIETQLRKGNTRALRDAATLLDKPSYHNAAVIILEENSFFTKQEIDIPHTTREQFMAFYFANADKIKYSDILKAFYITPIENQSFTYDVKIKNHTSVVEPTVELRNLSIEFEKVLKRSSNSNELIAIIEKIEALNCREGFQWLRNTLLSTPFNKSKTELYIALCDALKSEPIEDNLKAILAVSEKRILPIEMLSPSIIELTNYTVTPIETQRLRDSLESFEALRQYGYNQILPFKEEFYYEKVDYYGKILSRKDTPWIQRNAMRDMLNTKHPRMLLYLASLIRLKKNDGKLEALLKKLTNTEFVLPKNMEVRHPATGGTEGPDKNKNNFNTIENLEKTKEFVRYWANNAEEFEWDEGRFYFVNKNEVAVRTENYERLYRRLNSENDSVALASFIQLTEGDPSSIANLTEKFRPLLRTYNRLLPDIHYGYLEQMSRLVSFCQRNNISLKLPKNIDDLLQKLTTVHVPEERYSIENQLIKEIKLTDITALEYQGCIFSNNPEMALSIGRMLDLAYTQHWKKIIADDDLIRLFLKKSALFKKIGVVGICSSYHNKMDNLDEEFRKRMGQLARLEGDNDILTQLQVLVSTENTKTETKSLLDMFLNDPLSFSNNDLKILPPPTDADYNRIIAKVQSENDREIIRLVLDFLDLHPSVTAVPSLYAIITDDRRLKTTDDTEGPKVSERVVNLLELIYGHTFRVDDKRTTWRKLWYKEKQNYKNWDKSFFDEQIRFVELADVVKMDEILEVSNSKYLNIKHKTLLINALTKLLPFSDIRRFKSKLPLKASTDLKPFDSLSIAAKDLDDFVKVFEVDSDTVLWQFINQKMVNYTPDEAGIFYNSLFKVNWFTNLISTETISAYQKDLAINTMQNYLTNSELISEFEEQNTLLHIAELQNVGRTLEQKLEASITLDLSEDSKATIQEAIISRISFTEISTILNYVEKLSTKAGYSASAYLYKDFGIPIFNLDKNTSAQLLENHKKMTGFQFYKHYLKKFGVDFLKDNDELDYKKIYNILKYEIVTPFTGGGSQRDYFTYGIIKLLEFDFNTRLGFHEKLNENQTFYTHTAAKRAAKWMSLFEERHLVQPDPSVPASFNRLFAEN